MNETQLKILELLYANIANVAKNNGWSEQKIRKMADLQRDDVKVALGLLNDKRLLQVLKKKIKFGKDSIEEIKYRITQKGIDKYITEMQKHMSC